ncbi:hypothetical protein T439DRAFT_377233 [Meredithblackwellia eburnea MCA 4105]
MYNGGGLNQWGQQQQHYGAPPPQFQPQQPQQQGPAGYYAPPPHHQFHQPPPHQTFHRPGLGAPGAAQNLPPPPNLAQSLPPQPQVSTGFPGVTPSAAWNGEKFSLFVGNIAEGVVDGWLERILGTAGPVISLRRPSPPFGFVEYGDPESVLRCLEVVNGALIVGKEGSEKAILIKADDKTRARLDQYETGRVKTEETAEFLQRAKDDLEDIVRLMKSGEPPVTSTLSGPADRQRGPDRPFAHLQDLAPEDLPETQREVITSEIALFRERSAKRAAEKKEQERQMEQKRLAAAAQRNSAAVPGQQNSNNGWGPRGGSNGAAAGAVDPQSYNKPIGFVAGTGSRGAENVESAPTGPTDEEQERSRLERERREAENMFRDRERRLEGRERSRMQAVERERAKERSVLDQEDRDRVATRERLSMWDDDKEAERGHELFYADRVRWRAQRRQFRTREMEADSRDRKIEAEQLAALHKESEDFLARQADMFAKISEGKNRGIARALPSAEDGVKLSFGAAPKVAPKAAPPPRPAVLGSAEDDEDGKKKRELIPLSYSDDEDEEKPRVGKLAMSASERERKIEEIESEVPQSKDALWSYQVAWGSLSESIISEKIKPLTVKLIVDHLGGEEEELLNAVEDHIRSHKDASALVDELEPVLDDEATEFVRKIWRSLIVHLALAQAGIMI